MVTVNSNLILTAQRAIYDSNIDRVLGALGRPIAPVAPIQDSTVDRLKARRAATAAKAKAVRSTISAEDRAFMEELQRQMSGQQ